MSVFFISDTHFGHEKLLSFGVPRTYDSKETVNGEWVDVKKPFITIQQHDQCIEDNWNKVVTDKDTVWHLGDVAVGGDPSDETIERLKRLKGRKNLVMGNHCSPTKIKKYADEGIFNIIVGVYEFKGDVILSHIPVHTQQLCDVGYEGRFKANFHGHLHSYNIMKKIYKGNTWDGEKHIPFYEEELDTRYVNVSMEQINMRPIPYDVIKDNLRKFGHI